MSFCWRSSFSTIHHSLLLGSRASLAFWDTLHSGAPSYPPSGCFLVTIAPSSLLPDVLLWTSLRCRSFPFSLLISSHQDLPTCSLPYPIDINSILLVAQVLVILTSPLSLTPTSNALGIPLALPSECFQNPTSPHCYGYYIGQSQHAFAQMTVSAPQIGLLLLPSLNLIPQLSEKTFKGRSHPSAQNPCTAPLFTHGKTQSTYNGYQCPP